MKARKEQPHSVTYRRKSLPGVLGCFVISTAMVLAATVFGVSSASAAARLASSKGSKKHTPVGVGYLIPLAGPFAANGQAEENGYKLGLKHFGSKIDGHKIKTTYLTTHGTPNASLTDAKQLIAGDHVQMVNGPQVSSEIAGDAPYFAQTHTPADTQTYCSEIQYQDYRKYGNGLATDWSCDQPSMMGGEWAAKTMHWKHVVTIGIDISFGWEAIGGFSAVFQKYGGTIDKMIWTPASATTLSSYVSEIPKTTQAVYAVLSGTQAVSLVKNYVAYGLQGIPLMGITNLTDATVLPAEGTSALGVYTDAQYCDGISTKANKTFVKDYHQTFGAYPGYFSEGGYVQAEVEVAALKSLHGKVKSEAALAKALRAVNIRAPRGPVSISKRTFSPVQNVYICKVENVHGTAMDVPIKTYANVQPNGPLSPSAWLQHFTANSSGPPSS